MNNFLRIVLKLALYVILYYVYHVPILPLIVIIFGYDLFNGLITYRDAKSKSLKRRKIVQGY